MNFCLTHDPLYTVKIFIKISDCATHHDCFSFIFVIGKEKEEFRNLENDENNLQGTHGNRVKRDEPGNGNLNIY